MAEATNTPKMTPEALAKVLASLSPEQLALIRGKAMEAGLPPAGSFQQLPDGSIRLTVVLPPEVAQNIMEWDRGGLTAEEFVRGQVVEAATNHVFGSWAALEPPPAEKPIPAGGIPAGTPAAAAAK